MIERARADRFGDSPWLRALLTQPSHMLEMRELPQHWRQTELHFQCDRPDGFQAGDWMVRSVRGALGRTLRAAQAHEAHLPATAFEGLFQNHAMLDGIHIPKPVRFEVNVRGDEIRICIRLFGAAEIWRDSVVEAMVLTLHQGIGLWENGSILRPWPIRDWYWTRTDTLTLPEWTGRAHIQLESPFRPGSSEVFAGDFTSSLLTLISRIRGLARWSSIEIDAGEAKAASRALADAAILHPGHGFGGFIRKFSAGDEAIVGVTGTFDLFRFPEILWPALLLGTQIGAGGHAIYGFGRYSLHAG